MDQEAATTVEAQTCLTFSYWEVWEEVWEEAALVAHPGAALAAEDLVVASVAVALVAAVLAEAGKFILIPKPFSISSSCK
jgi:hypothetical protein